MRLIRNSYTIFDQEYPISFTISALLLNNLMLQSVKQSDRDQKTTANQSQKVEQNPTNLLNNPTSFLKFFELSTSICSQLIGDHQYEKSIIQLNKTLSLIDLGNQVLKNISPYWKLCIYGNLAMCHQRFTINNILRLWQIQKSHKYCLKVIKQLNSFINAQNKIQVKLVLMKKLIRINFQHCAILSQINQHAQALDLCRATFQLLKNFLTAILQFINTLQRKPLKKSVENIFFIEQVGNFAEDMIKLMLVSLNEPIQQKIHYNPQFYFWSRNPGKNEQQITRMILGKKTKQQSKRSILGVNKNKAHVSEFNIGSIMHIEEYHIHQFKHFSPLEEYLFKDRIYQLIINCSLSFFTLATELRFVETKQNSLNSHRNMINKKYGYQQKSDAYKLSEVYHMKSIEIVAKNIPYMIPYLTHIIRSYQKHYIINKPLPIIQSIADESLFSTVQHCCFGEEQQRQKSTTQDLVSNQLHDDCEAQQQQGQYQFHKIKYKKNRSVSKVPFNIVNYVSKDTKVIRRLNINSEAKQMYQNKDVGRYHANINAPNNSVAATVTTVVNIGTTGSGRKKKKSNSVGKVSNKNRKIVKKMGQHSIPKVCSIQTRLQTSEQSVDHDIQHSVKKQLDRHKRIRREE